MQPEEKKFSGKRFLKLGLIAVGGFIVLLFIVAIFGGSSGSSSPAVAQPVAVSTKVAVGEEGYIKFPSANITIATTQEGFKQIVKSSIANDDRGIAELIYSKNAFLVANGTKVLVIDSAVGARKIRILEGDKINETGWTAMEFISKTK